MNNNISYTLAIEELECILSEIENSDIPIDSLAEKVKRAAFLIEICQKALHITEEEVKKILEEMNKTINSDMS